jgi:tetratricopeptide (TPR) repeat protein
VVLLLAAGLRIAAFAEFTSRMPLDYTHFTELDNFTWHQFGVRIAAGDILYRNAFLPCHSWAQVIAPAHQWVAWYGGPSAFYQAPLYGYFVGAVYAVAGVNPDRVYAVQLFLGVVRVLLVYLVARRFFRGWIPLVAALLAAVYAPFIFFEMTMLRESLLTLLNLAGLLAIVAAMRRRRAALWGLAGFVAGVDLLAKPSAIWLGAVLLVMLSTKVARERLKFTLVYALLFAVPVGLLVARNAALGQPLLQIDTRGPVTFISGNAPDTVVEGPVGFHLPPSTRETVWKTKNQFPDAVLEVLKAHAGAPEKLAGLWWRKTRAFWRDYEVPNNVNFYHARNVVAGLRLPFTSYAFLLPLAILGMIATVGRRKELFPLYVFMALIFLQTIAFIVLARFRLLIVPYLSMFAAAGLCWLGAALRSRRSLRVLGALGVMGAALVLTAREPSWAPAVMQSRSFLRDLESYRRLAEQQDPRTDRTIPFAEASRMLNQVKADYEGGRHEACIEPLERVLASFSDLLFTRYVLARCHFELYLEDADRRGDLDRAEAELTRVLRVEPDAPYAQGLKRALEAVRSRESGGNAERGTTD